MRPHSSWTGTRSLFRARAFAIGDPGLHLVVVVSEIVLGDVVGGGGPDTVMPEDVGQHLVEMLGRVRPADIVRSSDRHMTRPFSAPI
jgi:hypothetical protein